MANSETTHAFKSWRTPHWRTATAISVILVVLSFVVSYAVWSSARVDPEPPVKFERDTIQSAIQSYKEKFGEYPPSIDHDDIRRHFRVAFPRYKRDGDPIADLQELGLDPDKLDAREVVVFWLAGLPQPADLPKDFPVYRKLTGFFLDVTDPIVGGDALLRNQSKLRTSPFYDFIESRLIDTDGDRWLEYQVRGTQSDPIWYEYDTQKHEIVFSRDPEK